MKETYFQDYGTYDVTLQNGTEVHAVTGPDYRSVIGQIRQLDTSVSGIIATPELITMSGDFDAATPYSRATANAVRQSQEDMQRESTRLHTAALVIGTLTLPERVGLWSHMRGNIPEQQVARNSAHVWQAGQKTNVYHKTYLSQAEAGIFPPADRNAAIGRCVLGQHDSLTQVVICSDLRQIAEDAQERLGQTPSAQLANQQKPGETLLDPRVSALVVPSRWASPLFAGVDIPDRTWQSLYKNSLEAYVNLIFDGYDAMQDIVVADGGYGRNSVQRPFSAHFARS